MIRGIDGGAGAITWHPHNRATIARRNPTPPLQLPKKLPAFEFWQVVAPSQPPTGCPDGWLVDISMAPKHLCLEAPVRPGQLEERLLGVLLLPVRGASDLDASANGRIMGQQQRARAGVAPGSGEGGRRTDP